MFKTKPTYNGSKMKFCSERHRKAFDKEGEKPIDVILRKQERRMHGIAREEIARDLFGQENRMREIAREEFARLVGDRPHAPRGQKAVKVIPQ